jgi:hypothetical protein
MKKYFLHLALLGSWLAGPAAAQVSMFHGDLGVGLVPLRSKGPGQANPNGSGNTPNGYVLQTTNADLLLLNANLGLDMALLKLGSADQALGVSLNATAGLLGTTRQDVDGFNGGLVLDFPQYLTYRYGAKASRHAKKDFGVGVGVGYRFCRFFLPFNSTSAMVEGVWATAERDWFVRLSGDLRPTRFYNYYSSEGPVEVLRLREFNLQIGSSF